MLDAMSELLVRTSERTQFTRCRWAWWQSYVEQLKPQVESPALRFGTLIHKALEARYPVGQQRGPHPAEVFAEVYKQELLLVGRPMQMWTEDDEKVSPLELGCAMMEGFVNTYGEDERYEVIASEQTFRVPIRNEQGAYLYTYVGTLDGIWRDLANGDILIIDWKTTKAISVGHLILDEQASSYWTYGPAWMVDNKILDPGDWPSSIMYTFMRKAMPIVKPRDAQGRVLNKDGSVSKQQPAPLFHREIVYRDQADRRATFTRATHQIREMKEVRSGRMSAYKSPGQHCNWCGYRDICELHETGSDWEAMRDMTMAPWDPYAAHEIEDERRR